MENPIKIDDLEVPPFKETPSCWEEPWFLPTVDVPGELVRRKATFLASAERSAMQLRSALTEAKDLCVHIHPGLPPPLK